MPSRGQKYISPFNSSYSLPYSHFHCSLFFIPSPPSTLRYSACWLCFFFFFPSFLYFLCFGFLFIPFILLLYFRSFAGRALFVLDLESGVQQQIRSPAQPTGLENIHTWPRMRRLQLVQSREYIGIVSSFVHWLLIQYLNQKAWALTTHFQIGWEKAS